jgi:hypothetical protein
MRRARWIAEHLIERDGNKIRFDFAQVQFVGGDEGGGVEQDVPAVGVRFLDPFERML